MVKYSVVIPVYNTNKVLFELTERLEQALSKLTDDYEIIFVNDHSPNKASWAAIQALCAKHKKVKGVDLSRNFGQQSATICGLTLASGAFIITMDDDLQHNPEDISKLLEHSDEYDIVIGHFKSKKHSFFKKIASRIKGYFDRIILGKPKGIQLSAFRLLSRNVVDGMLSIKTPTPFIPALMFYVSKNVKGVKLEHAKRLEGKTGYTLYKMLKLFSFLLINNSSILLRVIGNSGLLISAFSFLFILYILMQRLIFDSVIQGWSSTIILILFFGGIQLFTLGIIGEYLIRIIRNVEEKPAFHIRKILN